jgi:hypothetical protein
VQVVDRQLVVAQGIAVIAVWSSYHQPGDEVRARVVGEIPA